MGMITPRTVASLAFEYFAAALAPPHCAACDGPVPVLAAFCNACAATIERARPPREPRDERQPFSALVYDGAAAQAIVRMKYGGRPDLARPLGDMLWRALQPHAALLASSVVVPVPLHAMRLAERGFNQSALIARGVAKRLGAPLQALALVRVRDTPRQAVLEREARLTNVVGAFAVAKRAAVAQRNVLLVDDVCTTGATLDAAAHALREAGALEVRCAVVAQAVRAQ
jgi:ComF family protein